MNLTFSLNVDKGTSPGTPRISDTGSPPVVPFVMIPNHVATDKRLDFRARCVVMALVHFSFRRASCYPSNATLAAWVGTSEASIRRDLEALESAGHIRRHTVKPHPGNPTGRVIVLCWRVDASAPSPDPTPEPDPGPSLSLAYASPDVACDAPPRSQPSAPPLLTAMSTDQDCIKTELKTEILPSRAVRASRDAGARENPPTHGANAMHAHDADPAPGQPFQPSPVATPWDEPDPDFVDVAATVGPVGCNDARSVDEVLWLADQLFPDTSVRILCRQWLADTTAARVMLALQRADAVRARRPTRYIQALIDDETFGQPKPQRLAAGAEGAGGYAPRETAYQARERKQRDMLQSMTFDDINL